MLCPSVWEFKPKRSSFHEEKGDINSTSSIINNHYFNHLVSVVLPDTPNISNNIRNVLNEDCNYYKVNDFNLSDIVNNDFIHSFVKSGQATALSIDTHLDTDDCIAITPTGNLILSLNKESFQSLGLEGKPYSRHKNRFCVNIDLQSDSLTSEKKTFQRIQWSLKNNIKKFTMLFVWKPPEDKICPSSIASYLSTIGYNVILCKPKHICRKDYNITVPLLINYEKESLGCDMAELTEWLGVYSIGGDLENNGPNTYLTTYECPFPNKVFGQVSFLQWTGLFTHHVINNLCNELRNYVMSRESLPWVSLYVQGFSDAPQNCEKFYNNESNSYTMFLLPSGHYQVVTQDSSSFSN